MDALAGFASEAAYCVPLGRVAVLAEFTDYRPAHDLLILPMRLDDRTTGLIAVESAAEVSAQSVQLLVAYAYLAARTFECESHAARLAHDLNGPLTVIVGYCELLLEAGTQDASEIQTILAKARQMAAIADAGRGTI
ncbi:MAG: hypothetical protein M3Y21_11835 [Candidatus Eremiobacteraeota bacterium]|nr:hypothetical protein [Candidatus Eremiobacteraeota bacterium]